MAVWHFTFNIIQKDKRKLKVSEGDYSDKVIFWSNQMINKDSLGKLAIVLPIEKSWSNQIIQYGNNDETNIQFFYNEDLLEEISCHIDIRNITQALFNEIINFINNNDADIYHNGNIYCASKEMLVKLITQSSAYKFCTSPIDFFKNLDARVESNKEYANSNNFDSDLLELNEPIKERKK